MSLSAVQRLTAICSDGFFTSFTSSSSSGTDSVRTKIRKALKRGLEAITVSNGYQRTIREVNDPPRNFQNMRSFPAINVLWGRENRTNMHLAGNNSLLDISLELQLDVFFKEERDVIQQQDNLLADIQTYLGNNFYLPDTNGDRTAFDVIYSGFAPFTSEEQQTMNISGMEIYVEIFYKIALNNPRVSC